MRNGRQALVLVLVLLSSLAPHATSAQELPRVSIAVTFGVTTADAATMECCELRTPPSLVTLIDDDAPMARIIGVDGRFEWTLRTSTFLQFERSNERSWHLTFPRPATLAPPFTTYEAERRIGSRHDRWTVGETVELLTTGRVRPWLFGALDVRNITERQHGIDVGFIDPAVRIESNTNWRRRQLSVAMGGGVRVHVSPRSFVGVELSRNFGVTDRCPGCDRFVRISDLERARATSIRGLALLTKASSSSGTAHVSVQPQKYSFNPSCTLRGK